MTNPFVQISQHPMVAVKISQLRDKDQSPKIVRELVHDLSSLLAYEATKDISLRTKDQIVCAKNNVL
jgi:uracil phosphoribosyltransferase